VRRRRAGRLCFFHHLGALEPSGLTLPLGSIQPLYIQDGAHAKAVQYNRLAARAL
jgi:hypothetical protein